MSTYAISTMVLYKMNSTLHYISAVIDPATETKSAVGDKYKNMPTQPKESTTPAPKTTTTKEKSEKVTHFLRTREKGEPFPWRQATKFHPLWCPGARVVQLEEAPTVVLYQAHGTDFPSKRTKSSIPPRSVNWY